MASTFKNAGATLTTTDSGALYTAPGSGQAVIHALYITNKSEANNGFVDVKVTTDGGSTFFHIGKSLKIEPENTLMIDKPINMESNDVLRVVAELNPDSSTPDIEAVAAILEVT